MLTIKKMRSDIVIDFAAEELKKYIRMMMPVKNPVNISYEPGAKDGFRLGLLEDFGLPCEAKDTVVDDVIHIDTTETGGILAGSNPRSVLFAVYRYLKLNGCRFLFPGAEGEHIPKKQIEAQKYHKLADHRYRGHSIEGDPSLEQVIDYIDWHAKEELNGFGSYGIFNYMGRYYKHRFNEKNRAPEYMDIDTSETQWRALFECEAKKRGLLLNGGGHDLLPKALGLDINDRFLYRKGEKEFPAEVMPYLAEVNGKREFQNRDFFYTQLCMSNPEVRTRIANATVKRVIDNPELDVVGVSLGDGPHCHCECPECSKRRPSDWFVMILNEIDAEMTRLGFPTKITFSFYLDIMFAPEVEKLKNPDRFMLNLCPISRNYAESITSLDNLPEPIPYVRNKWKAPKTMPELFSLLKGWQEVYKGSYGVFDYHFWRHQYRDPGLAAISRRVYEDVMSYRPTGMAGCMQDGSDKSFFPHGFHGHIYAEALMNRDCDYEAELADYFSHFYGKDWEVARNYLDKITEAFDHKFMCGLKSADAKKSRFYNPAHATSLAEVKELAAEMREFIAAHPMHPTRTQSNAWKILLRHTEYCEGLAEVMIEKCLGHTKYALELFAKFTEDFGKHDKELERWLDYGLCMSSLHVMLSKLPKIEL